MKRYLLSYLSIAIFACTAISLVVFFVSVNEMHQLTLQESARRAQSIVDDLDEQMDIMQNIAYTISTMPEYKLSNLQKSKYREIEMLEDLSKYQGYTPLASQFFLYYVGKENIFVLPEKTSCRFSLYAQTRLAYASAAESAQFHQELIGLAEADILKMPNGNLLFCYPLWFTSASNADGYLCFVVTQDSVAQRVRLIGGNFVHPISLYHYETCIYGEAQEAAALELCGENGVCIQLNQQDIFPYRGITAYANAYWAIIAGTFIVTCAMALIAAKRHYKPIYELVHEIGGAPLLGKDELESLRVFLRRAVDTNKITQKQLQENAAWLNQQRQKNQEQMMLLALTGLYHAPLQQTAQRDDPLEEGRHFAVICVSCRGKYLVEELLAQICELGSADLELVAVRLPYESLIAVVASSWNGIDSFDVVRLLRELMEADHLAADFGVGLEVDSARRIPDSFAAALVDINNQMHAAAPNAREWYSEDKMEKLLAYIKAGQVEEARLALDAILTQIEALNPSILLRSYAYSSVINAVIRMARQNDVEISSDKMSVVLLYNQPEQARQRIFALLDELCMQFVARKDHKWEAKKAFLLAYIREHYLEYSFCLTELENVAGLSIRQIEQILRGEVHMTFKEYLTGLRMEEAKRLLATGMSVTEASNAVCYMSVSFFIKVFKRQTGMTPAEYKKSLEF